MHQEHIQAHSPARKIASLSWVFAKTTLRQVPAPDDDPGVAVDASVAVPVMPALLLKESMSCREERVGQL